MKKRLIWLIFILALLTRFISLQSLPPALNRDEAAIGWNSYSILQTSRDEHGQYLPLAFKSIGDYKMPLYIYAATIPVKLFGLNDFSIRFWSALAGAVSVLAVFYLVKALTKKTSPPIIAALLLALNPWAIFYSRIGFEANLSLAFFLSAMTLLLYGFKSIWRFNLGLLLLLASFLTYSSSLIFTPIFLAIFLFINRKKLTKNKVVVLTIFSLISILIFKSIWNVSAQKSNITVFSNPTIINQYNQTRTQIYQQNKLLARTWWNKKVFYTRLIANNYFKSFSPEFLLTVGGNHPWHRIPGVGNFLFVEIFLAIIGLYSLFKNKNKANLGILLTWLLIAPLASAITIDAPHSTRSLYLLPVILILSALGFSQLKNMKFKKENKRKIITLLSGLYLINLVYFGYQYIFIYPQKFPQSIPLGLKELITQNTSSGNVYFYGIHDSNYLYPLIYLPTDPDQFQKQAVWTQPDLTNLTNVHQFNHLTVVDQPEDLINPDYVFWPSNKTLGIPNVHLIDQSGFYSLYQAD